MAEKQSIFDIITAENLVLEIPFQFSLSDSVQILLQCEPVKLWNVENQNVLLSVECESRVKFAEYVPFIKYDPILPSLFYHPSSTLIIKWFYSRYTATRDDISAAEDIVIKAYFRIKWIQHLHPPYDNYNCGGQCQGARPNEYREVCSIVVENAEMLSDSNDRADFLTSIPLGTKWRECVLKNSSKCYYDSVTMKCSRVNGHVNIPELE